MLTVLGEAIIDLVPVPGPTAGLLLAARPGGSPFNVAVGTARLGQPTQFRGRVSTDPFGRRLRDHLTASGVDVSAIIDAAEPSTVAVTHVDALGRASYEFYRAGTADWAWSAAELATLGTPRVLHTGSLASWLAPGAQHIATLTTRLRHEGRTLLTYDPNLRPQLLGAPAAARAALAAHVAAAHVVKASRDDVEWLTDGADPADVAQRWLADGAELVVITDGAAGISGFSRSIGRIDRPAPRVSVVDTIGAGDAAMAGLLDGLRRQGADRPGGPGALPQPALAAVLDHAALVAALTCTRPGADPPTAAELTEAVGPRDPLSPSPGTGTAEPA